MGEDSVRQRSIANPNHRREFTRGSWFAAKAYCEAQGARYKAAMEGLAVKYKINQVGTYESSRYSFSAAALLMSISFVAKTRVTGRRRRSLRIASTASERPSSSR